MSLFVFAEVAVNQRMQTEIVVLRRQDDALRQPLSGTSEEVVSVLPAHPLKQRVRGAYLRREPVVVEVQALFQHLRADKDSSLSGSSPGAVLFQNPPFD